MRPEVAVAFVVREKFSWARASLERLYANAGTPFTLYLVDCGYPPAVRAEVGAFLADHEHDHVDVVRIEADRFLYPNEALNRVIEQATEPYLCVLQNDVMIRPQAIRHLLNTARLSEADVVSPRMLDADAGRLAIHRQTDRPRTIVEEGGQVYVDRDGPVEVREGRPRVFHFEMHCLLMGREITRAVYPLPPLNSREHIDLAVALWRRGGTAVLDDRAEAIYMGSPPLPLHPSDRAYFAFRWDVGRARWSHEYVEQTWRIADLPSAMDYVIRQGRSLAPETRAPAPQ